MEFLAPNGKPSNLTPEQWKLVRTPEFKSWFGDWENDPENASKVVDENGEPLVVYHGTHQNKFHVFEFKRKSNFGFYFSNSKTNANTYGDLVIPVFLNIKKPLIINAGNKNFKEKLELPKSLKNDIEHENGFLIDEVVIKTKNSQLYDGNIFYNLIDSYKLDENSIIQNTLVVFEPNQIKLADGTNSTFDGTNPDIRFEEGGMVSPNGKPSNLTPEQWKLVRTPKFKAWFGDWITMYNSSLIKVVNDRLLFNDLDIGLFEYTLKDAETIEIDRLYIDDEYKKRGVGKSCIQYLFNKYSVKKIEVYPSPKTQEFWLNNGVYNVRSDGYYEIDDKKYICSKIIDENGEPLVVYHGTTKEFTEFDLEKTGSSTDTGMWGKGFYFTDNIDYASNYAKEDGKLMSLFLNIRNPLYINSKSDIPNLPEPETMEEMMIADELYSENFRKHLISENNDGVISSLMLGGTAKEFVALFPEQIKLADGTNTNFDPKNSDIRFEDGGVLENVNYLKLYHGTSLKNISKIEKEGLISNIGYSAGWYMLSTDFESALYHGNALKEGDEVPVIEFEIPITETDKWDGYPYVWVEEKRNDKSSWYAPKKAIPKEFIKKIHYVSYNDWLNQKNDKYKKGGQTISQTPAPKKERIYGSVQNKPESSESNESAKSITFDSKTISTLNKKVREHNKKHPDKKITLSSAKAVVRRGMGAYSKSHRPTISGGKPNSRVAWGLARLNAFIYKIVNGKSKSGKYNQDDDLIKELGYEVQKYELGGELSEKYQFRDIGGSIVYYKKVGNGSWLFISKDEFDQKANKNNIILFNSKMENNPKDTITMDVPLFIRMLELAREDIKSDAQLHKVVERVIDLSGKEMTMDDYDYIIDEYAEGGEVWNVNILTNDNKLIHRRYNSPVTHKDIFDEYKLVGVEVKDAQIHQGKPIDFFDVLRDETKRYVQEKMNEQVDEDTIMIKSYHKGNEYHADEIHGETVSGIPFSLSPFDLYSENYARGGSIESIMKRPYARLYFYIYNDAYGNMELGSERIKLDSQKSSSIVDGVFLNFTDCLYEFIRLLNSEWMNVILKDQLNSKFEIRSAFYDGISYDERDESPVKKEKTILSISAKNLKEYRDLNRFEKGGQTEENNVQEEKENVLLTDYDTDGKISNIHFSEGNIPLKLENHWYDYDTSVELVPVSELIKFREFDRKKQPKWNKEESIRNINSLTNKFKSEGIKEPLIIEYNHEDKKVLLIEGNHRLNVAIDLGLEYLPARVRLKKFGKYTGKNAKNAMPVVGVEANEFGYISSDLTPSQVGISGAKKLKYEEGGIIEGQLHSECNEPHGCGEKFQVGEGGHIIEAERDEAVIVSEAFKDNQEYVVEGTPSEIASALNVMGGGKNFDSGATIKDSKGKVVDLPEMKVEAKNTDVEPVIESGSVIINRRSMADDQEYQVEGTPKEIASAINSLNGNGVVIEDGAEIKKL